MFNIRSATIGDTKELVECYVEIWGSLREWLPESFVNSEIDRIRSEGKEWLEQIIRSECGIVLLAKEDNEIIGVALGRVSEGVCHLGFLGVKKRNIEKRSGNKAP